jgi:voltage-gated potassium channel
MAAHVAPLTAEQTKARERWQARWNTPILLAALVPLFVTSPKTRWVQVVVGLGSWVVFVIDLVVQRRIDPHYLRRRNGRIDLAIVLLTFPYYLISGLSGASAILLLARLARVVRVFLATSGLRRFAARLGKVTLIAGVVVVVASLAAYQAEHATNSEFATVGDALWWGIVTLTTVGYGDIVPKTHAGRFCGVAIMITGVAVLGVLAGSLSSLFNLEPPSEQENGDGATDPGYSVPAELAMLQAQLREVERRLGQLAAVIPRAAAKPNGPGSRPDPPEARPE